MYASVLQGVSEPVQIMRFFASCSPPNLVSHTVLSFKRTKCATSETYCEAVC